jgi:hypothetical protein
MTDQLKRKYDEIAAYIYSFCKKMGCTPNGKLTGLCCDHFTCDLMQEQAGQKFEIELDFEKMNTFVNSGHCIVPPHLRPLCSVHACERLQLWAPGFFDKWMRMREVIEEMEYRERKKMSKKVKRETFKVGDKVCWSSQAGSYWKKKEGVVIRVVGAGEPCNCTGDEMAEFDTTAVGCFSRDHESYVVSVTSNKAGRIPKLYRPVVGRLKLVESVGSANE